MSVIRINFDQDQQIDVGECTEHRRIIECYCNVCNTLICATCLMFGDHKGHSVCKIEEGYKNLRSEIDQAAKDGLLKVEDSESVLLDVRQTKLLCEESKQKIMSEIEDVFNQLLQSLKDRKQEVKKDVESYFNQQLEVLQKEEQRWTEKQNICVELLNLAKSQEDAQIVQNSQSILESIANLREEKKYHQINLLNNMDTNFEISSFGKDNRPIKENLSYKELIRNFKNYAQKGEVHQIQFRS